MSALLSHIDGSGKARMVDVSEKLPSNRTAIAKGEIRMAEKTLTLIADRSIKKGEVLSVAQLAGVMAAKRTAELIPLCHPLQLTYVGVELNIDLNLPGIQITAEVKNVGQTGVEMEALTAVSIAALTVYDMVKAVDKTMQITHIRLVEKHGGVSGDVIYE
jgi:cyclic pyranopterin phosphate synthase